jgi:hypothetical protein
VSDGSTLYIVYWKLLQNKTPDYVSIRKGIALSNVILLNMFRIIATCRKELLELPTALFSPSAVQQKDMPSEV